MASVRSEQKAEEILDLHPSWKNKSLSFIYITDVGAPDAFDQVFKSDADGFDYIIHTASPVTCAVKDVQKDLIDPAVQGY